MRHFGAHKHTEKYNHNQYEYIFLQKSLCLGGERGVGKKITKT